MVEKGTFTCSYQKGLRFCDARSLVVRKAVWGLFQTLVQDTFSGLSG